jgi:hypothetical protein
MAVGTGSWLSGENVDAASMWQHVIRNCPFPLRFQ